MIIKIIIVLLKQNKTINLSTLVTIQAREDLIKYTIHVHQLK